MGVGAIVWVFRYEPRKGPKTLDWRHTRHQVMARYTVPGTHKLTSKSFAFDIPFESDDLTFETLLKGTFMRAEFHVDDVYNKEPHRRPNIRYTNVWGCIPTCCKPQYMGCIPICRCPSISGCIPKYWGRPVFGGASPYTVVPQYLGMHLRILRYPVYAHACPIYWFTAVSGDSSPYTGVPQYMGMHPHL